MAKGPEGNFWTALRKNLPKGTHATRIENRHGGGVPDVFLTLPHGLLVPIELKALKSQPTPELVANDSQFQEAGLVANNSQSQKLVANDSQSYLYFASKILRPNQVAWHARQMGCGGLSLVLAKAPRPGALKLLTPVSGPENGSHGLLLRETWSGDRWPELFEALRLTVINHTDRSLRLTRG